MASRPDPHFVVESIVPSAGGAPLVMARRIDDHEFVVRDGSLLAGAPIAAADISRAPNAVGEGRTGLWDFFLKNAGDLARLTVGQTIKLQEPALTVEHK